MLQNIFISSSLDPTIEVLNIHSPCKDIEEFKRQVNSELGFILIYNNDKKKPTWRRLSTYTLNNQLIPTS